MAKGKITAEQLKHDPLMEQYVKSSEWVGNRQKQIVTGLIVAAVLIVGFLAVRAFMNSQANKAGETLAEAFRWNDAMVANPLPPERPGTHAATTEDEKHKKAFEAFEKAIPSSGDLARYYAAVHQLYFDAPKAEATLKAVADGNSAVNTQARLALAERYRVSGKYNEALAEFKKLKEKPGDTAPLLIDLGVAQTHQAMGQTREASDLYFKIAKESVKTTVGTKALAQLTKIDPTRVEQLPQEEKKTGTPGSFSMAK